MASISYTQCTFIPTVDTSDFSFDRTELCTSVGTDLISDGTRQCANGSTPPLYSVEASFFSREFNNSLNFNPEPGEGKITFNIGMWIGLEERPDGSLCFWVGQEEAGICLSTCNVDADGNPALTDLENLVDVFVNELADFYSENDVWDLIATAGFYVAVGVIVALAAAVAPEIAIAAGLVAA